MSVMRSHHRRGLKNLHLLLPSLSVCTCMCMANQLGNHAPTMALVTNCDCHSYVGALRHSMPMITVLNKWIAIFSLIHVFSYD